MKNYKLETHDYIAIFEQVLKEIDIEINNHYEFIEKIPYPRNMKLWKDGLCILIIQSLNKVFPEITYFVDDFRNCCLEIIQEATGCKFRKSEYYWTFDDNIVVSIEKWYEPRIKCIKETIKYLKNLKTTNEK
jgi:hypothetical protein